MTLEQYHHQIITTKQIEIELTGQANFLLDNATASIASKISKGFELNTFVQLGLITMIPANNRKIRYYLCKTGYL